MNRARHSANPLVPVSVEQSGAARDGIECLESRFEPFKTVFPISVGSEIFLINRGI